MSIDTPLYQTGPWTAERPWRSFPSEIHDYSQLDLDDPVLHWQMAIETRNAEMVEQLLKDHPQLVQQRIFDRQRDGQLSDNRHLQVLDQVARTGHLKIAKLLIKAGFPREQISTALMLAEPNVATYLLEICAQEGLEDSAAPQLGFMGYLAKWEASEFWFQRGYQPLTGALHDACCGRPNMRHFALRDDSASKLWPLQYRETVRVLIAAGADVNERNLAGNKKWDGAKTLGNQSRDSFTHCCSVS